MLLSSVVLLSFLCFFAKPDKTRTRLESHERKRCRTWGGGEEKIQPSWKRPFNFIQLFAQVPNTFLGVGISRFGGYLLYRCLWRSFVQLLKLETK